MNRPQPSAPTVWVATVPALWTSFPRSRRLAGEGARLLLDAAWIAGGQGVAGVATLAGVRLIRQVSEPSLLGAFVSLNGAFPLFQVVLFQPFARAGLRFFAAFEALGHVPALRPRARGRLNPSHRPYRRYVLSRLVDISHSDSSTLQTRCKRY